MQLPPSQGTSLRFIAKWKSMEKQLKSKLTLVLNNVITLYLFQKGQLQ